MFIPIGNKLVNEQNITYIEAHDGRFAVHFTTEAHLGQLNINAGVLGDTSYADLRAWLKSQAGVSEAVAVEAQ